MKIKTRFKSNRPQFKDKFRVPVEGRGILKLLNHFLLLTHQNIMRKI